MSDSNKPGNESQVEIKETYEPPTVTRHEKLVDITMVTINLPTLTVTP